MAYIGVTVDDAVKDQLEIEAKACFRSLSAQVAHIIKEFFSSRESQNTTKAQNPSGTPSAVPGSQSSGAEVSQTKEAHQSSQGRRRGMSQKADS